jgi:hypothetical protein
MGINAGMAGRAYGRMPHLGIKDLLATATPVDTRSPSSGSLDATLSGHFREISLILLDYFSTRQALIGACQAPEIGN